MIKFSLFIIYLLFWMVSFPMISISEEFRKEGWSVPDLNGLVPYSISIRTADGAEVIIEKFYTPDGGHVARLSGNGKIFAYAVDSDQIPPIDYLLLDSDGTGKFSRKFKPDEKYLIPDWVLR